RTEKTATIDGVHEHASGGRNGNTRHDRRTYFRSSDASTPLRRASSNIHRIHPTFIFCVPSSLLAIGGGSYHPEGRTSYTLRTGIAACLRSIAWLVWKRFLPGPRVRSWRERRSWPCSTSTAGSTPSTGFAP